MSDNDFLNIGAFAVAAGLSIPALRHYDEIGLLKPARVDADSGYRRYGRDQLDRARLICGLRAIDLPIDEIRPVLAGRPDHLRATLDAHRERLVAQIRELSQRVAAADEFIAKGTAMPVPQRIRPVQVTIRVRDVAAAAAFYTAAFDLVYQQEISSLQFGTYRTEQFFLLTLEEEGPPPATAGGAHLGLLVDDLDIAHHQALAAGAPEVHPPMDFPWKPRGSCVRDPSDNLISLTQA